MSLTPGLKRSPGVGNGNPPQYSCLENSMDSGPWWTISSELAKSWLDTVKLMYPLSMHSRSHFPWKKTLSGEGNGTPLQYSCLENPMDGGAWWAAVHEVAKSRTWLSDFTFIFHFHALEKDMATHSSILAWRIPGTGEPGGLPSMGSHRVGHNWSDLAAAAAGYYHPEL